MTVKVQLVPSVYKGPIGSFRVVQGTPGGHPADGMRAMMSVGDGAYMDFPNPRFEWSSIRDWDRVSSVALSLLASYDYLLSNAVPMREVTRRLRLLRAGRLELARPHTEDK